MKQLSWLSSLQPLKRVRVKEDVHSLLILLISAIGIVQYFTKITQLDSVCLLSPSYHPTLSILLHRISLAGRRCQVL